jgi:hypothetical protein
MLSSGLKHTIESNYSKLVEKSLENDRPQPTLGVTMQLAMNTDMDS